MECNSDYVLYEDDAYDLGKWLSGWTADCGITKKEYKSRALQWHFARWCHARGVLRDQTNTLSFEAALKLDRMEARFFAKYLKLDIDDLCYV